MEQHPRAIHISWRAAQVSAIVTGMAMLLAGVAWLSGHGLVPATGESVLSGSRGLGWLGVLVGAGALAFAFRPVKADREHDALSQRWAHLMDNLDDVVMLSDQQRRIVDVNRRAETVYGYTRAELVGMSLAELRTPDAREDFEQTRQDYEVRERVVFQTVHRCKDGSTFPVEVSSRWVDVGTQRLSLGIIRDITERQRAQQDLIESERRFRSVVENLSDALYIHDCDGRILEVNSQACQMLGYQREELVGANLALLETEEQRPLIPERMRQLMREGRIIFDGEHQRKDGSHVPVSVSATVVSREGRGLIQGLVRDMTASKQTAAERERLIGILECTPDFVGISDLEGRFIYLNATARRLLGESGSVADPPRHLETFHPAWAADRVRNEGLPAAREDGFWVGETALLTKAGAELPVSQVIQAHKNERGEVTHYSTIMRDLSERKRFEQVLRQNEERLRTIIEHSNQLHYSHTPEHVLTYVSPQSRRFFDCEPEEALVRWTELVTDHPANAEGFKRTEEAIRTGRRQPPYELECVTRLGRKLWVEVDESPVVLRGKTVAIVGALTDITERKRAERGLVEREQRYRTLFDLSPVGILLEDAAGTILEANAASARAFGYTPEELRGSNVRRLVPPERLHAVDEHAAAILAGQVLAHETVNVAKDGTLRQVELRETAVPLPDGGKGILVLVQDITERKRAERALAASEESLRLALDGADLGSWDWDLRTGKIEWGGHHERLFGLPPGQFDGTQETFYRLVHPDDRESSREALNHALRERIAYRHQYRVIWPDGSVHWIASHGRFHFDAAGQAVRMNGIVMDITARRQSEEALRESQRFLTKAQEVTRLGCYDFQIARGGWSATPMLEEIFGLTPGYPKTVEGWLQLIHPEDREMMRRHLMEDVLQVGRRFEKEYRIIRPSDGQVRWLLGLGELEFDAVHRPVRMIGTIQDITDRKLAEAALREAEQRLARTIANLPAGFAYRCRNDQHWTMQSITAGVASLTGHAPEEFTSGRTLWNDLIHPADRQRVWREVQAAVAQRTSFQLEYRLRLADKKESWVWEQGTGVFAPGGELEGLEGLVVDITARKQAEAAARELSGRLLAAQDEERRRLARELHDTTAQTLAALCMNLTMLGAKLSPDDPTAAQLLAEAVALGEHAGQEIRTVAYLLHPPILEHVGLAGALREFAGGFSRRSGIDVTVEIGPTVRRYSPEVELALLRIVQESLGNVHRHSGSPTAIIRLRQTEEEIVLDVADVGKGFHLPKAAKRGSGGTGVGVAGMRERLRYLGGRLEINSGPAGTIVRAILPLPKPAGAGKN